ncbi:hypothetical protein AYO47_06210 [Planctomyces sp. SCGC AG-212-M04]|nr:hypothetical protein AYO47_06210 [Planctomyces sp. SCGC AG-212-M04]
MSPEKLAEIFATTRQLTFRERFNISPTQTVVAIRQENGERVPVNMRWGLVPSWAKDLKSGPPLINARGETVAEKPAFRSAFKKRRCLIPATGFYEWKTEGKQKCPFNIHLPDDIPFAFAGLWECWRGGGEPLESCTILTTAASEQMMRIHDRQPVILHRHEWSVWLNPEIEDTDALKTMIRPWDRELVFDSVDPCINNSRNEGADYFKPGMNTL